MAVRSPGSSRCGSRARPPAPRSPRSCSATSTPRASCRSPSPRATGRARPAPRASTPATATTSTTARARSSATAGTTPPAAAAVPLRVRPVLHDVPDQPPRRHPHRRPLVAKVTVTNTGPRAGAEVAQLYVGLPAPPTNRRGSSRRTRRSAWRPARAGGSRSPSAVSSLASWDNPDTGWVLHRGTYRIYVGDSSRSLPLHADVRM